MRSSRIKLPAKLPSSSSDLSEEGLNLLRLCTLVVDIQLRHKNELGKAELPDQFSPVAKDLEAFRQGEIGRDKN